VSQDQDKGGFSLKSLFIKDGGDEKADDEGMDTQTVPATTVNPTPPLLSTLSTVAAPVTNSKSAGPSKRTLDMLTEAQKQVPNDNAQFKLDAAMQSIEALESDATKRKAMALAILASQGISPEKVAEDARKASQIMSNFISTLSVQLNAQQETAVVAVRTNATSLREQAAELEAKIAEIRNNQTELTTQAGVLEASANAEEIKLNEVAAEIEAALAIINSSAT
jgi:hypothetical protein